MRNWKTTLGGIITAFGLIAPLVGMDDKDGNMGRAVAAVGAIVLGAGAKDSNVTGGTKPATFEASKRVE